jgi:hypothetical protein
MPRISQSPTIFQIYNPQLREQNPLSLDGRHLHHIAKNLATALNALHARGYVMGDVNQKNILVTTSALVTLVDTDSFQVRDPTQGRTYRCSVGVPDYTPPELQGVNLGSIDREPCHDCFGLAIIIFQLLMEGFHPFTGAPKNPCRSLPGEIYLHCIKQGIFPYQPNREFAPPPSAPDFAALHPEIQAMFVRCFVSGHRAPSTRPTPRQWIDALDKAEKGLVQCRRNKSHWYSNHTSKCPWCEREAKKPLPVQQPLAPPPPKPVAAPARHAPAQVRPQRAPPAPFMPAARVGGIASPQNATRLFSLLGALIACLIGVALVRAFSGSISYVPYSPGPYIAWNEGPITWGRAIGFIVGIGAAIVLPLLVWKDDGLPVRITMCIIWIPIGLLICPLIGMGVGMLVALVITGVLPLALGIALGSAGGTLLGVAIDRFKSSGGYDISAWRVLGGLVGGILSVVAWARGDVFLADLLFIPLFAWVGYGSGTAFNTVGTGVLRVRNFIPLWLLALYVGLIIAVFVYPAVAGFLAVAGLCVGVSMAISRRRWAYALAGVAFPLIASLGLLKGNIVGSATTSITEACGHLYDRGTKLMKGWGDKPQIKPPVSPDSGRPKESTPVVTPPPPVLPPPYRPRTEGTVVDIRPGWIQADLGERDGVQPGQLLKVIVSNAPVDGGSGAGHVVEFEAIHVSDQTTAAKIKDESSSGEPQKGDRVILNRNSPSVPRPKRPVAPKPRVAPPRSLPSSGPYQPRTEGKVLVAQGDYLKVDLGQRDGISENMLLAIHNSFGSAEVLAFVQAVADETCEARVTSSNRRFFPRPGDNATVQRGSGMRMGKR